MALKRCPEPECGKSVSTQAENCPHCGCPLDAVIFPDPQEAVEQTFGKGEAHQWAAEKELLKRLNKLLGRRWDAQQKSASEPEYYWLLRGENEQEVLVAAHREAEKLGLSVGPCDSTGDVGICIENSSAGRRLTYAY